MDAMLNQCRGLPCHKSTVLAPDVSLADSEASSDRSQTNPITDRSQTEHRPDHRPITGPITDRSQTDHRQKLSAELYDALRRIMSANRCNGRWAFCRMSASIKQSASTTPTNTQGGRLNVNREAVVEPFTNHSNLRDCTMTFQAALQSWEPRSG